MGNNSDYNELQQLSVEVSEIRNALIDIYAHIKKINECMVDWDKSHFELWQTHLDCIYPRIWAIEHHLFPEIATDLNAVDRLIGRPEKKSPPSLDRRPDEKEP
jgi:hypothetical protein